MAQNNALTDMESLVVLVAIGVGGYLLYTVIKPLSDTASGLNTASSEVWNGTDPLSQAIDNIFS